MCFVAHYVQSRYKALMAICLGESILQIGGASGVTRMTRDFYPMLYAVVSLFIVFSLGSMYYVDSFCKASAHPLVRLQYFGDRGTGDTLLAYVWIGVHPFLIMSLVRSAHCNC